MDAKRSARGRGRQNESGTGERKAVSADGIEETGRRGEGQVKGYRPGRARGGLKQRGVGGRGRGGRKEEVINGTIENRQSRTTTVGVVSKIEGKVITTKDSITGNGPDLNTGDFLQLLRLLHITVPLDNISQTAIELSKEEHSVLNAKTIIKDLENFELDFRACPQLPSRRVKHCLALKENGKVLDLTRLVFFERKEKKKEEGQRQWTVNTSNTGRGFRLREKYMKTPVSTPEIYSTAKTRSWEKLAAGEEIPLVTEGARVNLKDIESRKFADESTLWSGTNSTKKFGKNDADELESLKYFHELKVVTSDHVSYTKGNKVQYGFLVGRLDFLAEIQNDKKTKRTNQLKSKKLVIECKSTTGDMVGKLYTKTPDSQKAEVKKDHEYSFQVQTYLYILNKAAERQRCSPDTEAVMVLRHYHEGGEPPRDFHWSYLQKDDKVQAQIDGLRVFCQEEVLACFLAVLNLIFQKEM